MTPEMARRRAIGAGAGSGIGEPCARLLADRGASVGVVDVRGEAVARVVRGLSANGARAVGASCDVGSETEVTAAARRCGSTVVTRPDEPRDMCRGLSRATGRTSPYHRRRVDHTRRL
jgi:NAD(P)-dependent dehydrogenase (short-subunit alcohol dehydrogenase family)